MKEFEWFEWFEWFESLADRTFHLCVAPRDHRRGVPRFPGAGGRAEAPEQVERELPHEAVAVVEERHEPARAAELDLCAAVVVVFGALKT